MNLLVCVKQVPEIALVSVDADKGELSLPQSPGMVNPFDSYAIEEALRLKEKHGGTVTALSLGSKEAEYALREALALGVDEAAHLLDDSFKNADPITSAKIIAAGIRKLGTFDMILFGKQAVDSDGATIPPAVGGFMNLPAAMFVRKIEIGEGNSMTIERMTDDGFDRVSLALPAVVSVVKEINEPRLPSLKGKMMAKKKTITTLNAGDIGFSDGALDSPTKTVKAANPPARPKGEIISGTPEEIAESLFRKLRESQLL